MGATAASSAAAGAEAAEAEGAEAAFFWTRGAPWGLETREAHELCFWAGGR